MSSALVVFAKTPRPGACKTRLVPPLSYDDAAALSRCFIGDIGATVASVAARRGATACIAFEGAESGMRELAAGHVLIRQRGEGFGRRLENAAHDALALGHASVCLIGSDSPTLPERVLDAALDALEHPGERIALGPADDGGYYLLGVKTPHAALFDDRRIAWSTPAVAAQTVALAREIGVEPAVLEPWYDVDDAASLAVLCEELAQSGRHGAPALRTRAFLARAAYRPTTEVRLHAMELI